MIAAYETSSFTSLYSVCSSCSTSSCSHIVASVERSASLNGVIGHSVVRLLRAHKGVARVPPTNTRVNVAVTVAGRNFIVAVADLGRV